MDNAKAILEGLLFLSGEEGLTMDQMMHGLQNLEMDDIRVLLDALKKEYSSSSKGIELVEYANRFKFVTKEFVYPYGKQLFEEYKQPTLSQAAMETLAIIAYNEPITRGQVEKLRGVDSTFVIRTLVARGLIKECGKSDLPGRPLLYKTTDDFLDYFGLSSREELPDISKLEEDTNPKDLYTSIYKEEDYGRESNN